jgi:hypothetical protein
MRLWKALFYAVWHSDKVPVQQELALNLSRLVRILAPEDDRVFVFLETFFETMQREWAGIDKHRIDKYLSLVRRILHESLRYCLLPVSAQLSTARTCRLSDLLLRKVLMLPLNGIRFHVCEIVMDELCATAPKISSLQLLPILEPFISQSQTCADHGLFEHIVKDVFERLLSITLNQQTKAKSTVSPGALFAPSSIGGDVELSPLLEDQLERARNTENCFMNVDLGPLAQRIFVAASDKRTLVTHRSRLFELHSRFADSARRLGHASTDAQLYPPQSLEHPSQSVGSKRHRDGPVTTVDSSAATIRQGPLSIKITSSSVKSQAIKSASGSSGSSSKRMHVAPRLQASSVLASPSIAPELLAIPSISALASHPTDFSPTAIAASSTNRTIQRTKGASRNQKDLSSD